MINKNTNHTSVPKQPSVSIPNIRVRAPKKTLGTKGKTGPKPRLRLGATLDMS